jgi:hypothetical protein
MLADSRAPLRRSLEPQCGQTIGMKTHVAARTTARDKETTKGTIDDM